MSILKGFKNFLMRGNLVVVAAYNGLELPEAVREAQDYTWHALARGYRPGMGQFLPDRLFWAREDDSETPVDEARPARTPNLHRH